MKPTQTLKILSFFSFVILAVPTHLLHTQMEKTTEEQKSAKTAKTLDKKENESVRVASDSCTCSKSIDKIKKISKIAREMDINVTKAYRLKKSMTLMPQEIEDALHCECYQKTKAMAPSSASPKISRSDDRSNRSNLAPEGKKVALLTPSELGEGCKSILDLDYEFTQPLKFVQTTNMLRNLAADIRGDAVVILNYEEKKGASSKVVICDEKKLRENVFSDLSLKKFDSYIFDPRTGLSWQVCSRGQTLERSTLKRREGCTNEPESTDFSSNQDYCRSLPKLNGKAWRIPEIEELFTIAIPNQKSKKSKIDHSVFSNTPPEVYWSNTPYWSKKAIMSIDFESGRIIAYNRKETAHTRCVINFIPDKINYYPFPPQ